MKAILKRAVVFIFPRIKAGQSYLQSIKAELPVILLFTIGTLLLNSIHAFDFCQNPVLDTGLRVKEFKNEHCFLVYIDDEAYRSKTLFRGRSPLDAAKLSELLESISDCDTPLIVVDIDTSDQSFLPLRQKNFHNKKIVWAQGVSEAQSVEDSTKMRFVSTQPALIVDGLLGDGAPGDGDYQRLSGIPLFEPDRDGFIRRFKRTIDVQIRGLNIVSHGPVDTLAFKAYQEYAGTEAQEKHDHNFFDWIAGQDEDEVLLNFSSIPGRLRGYSAGDALGMSHDAPDTWKTAVDKRIIVVGGTYTAARDKCLTPVGYIDGVKLNLMAIETLCSGTLTRKIDELYLFVADILFGIIFVTMAHFLTKKKLFYAVIATFSIGIVLSIFFYSNFNMLISFVPVSIGLLAHLIYDYIQEHNELLEELAALKSKEVETLKSGLAQQRAIE